VVRCRDPVQAEPITCPDAASTGSDDGAIGATQIARRNYARRVFLSSDIGRFSFGPQTGTPLVVSAAREEGAGHGTRESR
jgi:hypothetical protein